LINEQQSIEVLGGELVPGSIRNMNLPIQALQQTRLVNSRDWTDANGDDAMSVP